MDPVARVSITMGFWGFVYMWKKLYLCSEIKKQYSQVAVDYISEKVRCETSLFLLCYVGCAFFGGLYICGKSCTFVVKLKKQSYETTRVQKVDGVSL